MKILIGSDTGIGNQVQFIPVIKNLLMFGHTIYSDSEIYHALNLPVFWPYRKKYDAIYLPFGYDFNKFLKVRIKHPFSLIYGYKYRILGRHFGIGYTESFKFDATKSEKFQNCENFGGDIYALQTDNDSGRVIIHFDTRKDRSFGVDIVLNIHNYLANNTNLVPVILTRKSTPTLKHLVELLRGAEYYIGCDSGVAHIADYLGLKSLVYFGSTDSVKSGITNGVNIQSKLNCSPCYRWGRINCTNENKYDCFNVSIKQIIDDINSVWIKKEV